MDRLEKLEEEKKELIMLIEGGQPIDTEIELKRRLKKLNKEIKKDRRNKRD